MSGLRWLFASVFIASVATWGAMALSFRFMPSAQAQNSEVTAPATSAVNGTAPGAASGTEIPSAPTEGPDGATAPSFEAMPTTASEDSFVYDPAGKRDPFRPYRQIRASIEKGQRANEEVVRELEPLERYDLEKLEVIAVLWDVRNPRAILRTPDGSSHTILKNSKVGRNFGKVVGIREGEIVVQEKIFNDGVPSYELKTLSLK